MAYFIEVVIFLSIVSLIESQQVSLTSNLQEENRNFYCDGERVTCNGTGLAIEWTAPPSIPSSQPEGFPFTAPLSTSRTFGDVTITLDQTAPFLLSTMTVQNIPSVEITCRTNNPGSTNSLILNRAVRPDPPENVSIMLFPGSDSDETVTITVIWGAANATGEYDISTYRVSLDINGTHRENVSASNTLSISTSLSGSVRITALVYVQTKCNGVSSDPGQVSLEAVIYGRNIFIIRENTAALPGFGIPLGITILTVIVLGIALFITCCCWYKSEKKWTKSNSPGNDL